MPSESVTVYFRGQTHTLASALREALENLHPEEYVACTVLHPMDEHLVVEAPSVQSVRTALLSVKEKIERERLKLV